MLQFRDSYTSYYDLPFQCKSRESGTEAREGQVLDGGAVGIGGGWGGQGENTKGSKGCDNERCEAVEWTNKPGWAVG